MIYTHVWNVCHVFNMWCYHSKSVNHLEVWEARIYAGWYWVWCVWIWSINGGPHTCQQSWSFIFWWGPPTMNPNLHTLMANKKLSSVPVQPWTYECKTLLGLKLGNVSCWFGPYLHQYKVKKGVGGFTSVEFDLLGWGLSVHFSFTFNLFYVKGNIICWLLSSLFLQF